jgi:ABC-type oligopeptide transport system substrate-binding subunit
LSKANPVANIDELLAATHASQDIATRKAAFATLMRAEREQALFAPLCSEQVIYLFRSNVKGFVPNLMGKPKFDGVYLES